MWQVTAIVNATNKSVQDNSNVRMQCSVLYAVLSLLVTQNSVESLFYVCNRTNICALNYQKVQLQLAATKQHKILVLFCYINNLSFVTKEAQLTFQGW